MFKLPQSWTPSVTGITTVCLLVLAAPMQAQNKEAKKQEKDKTKQESKLFVSKPGGFSVERHGFKEKITTRNLPSGEKMNVHTFQANSGDKKATWIVSYHDLPEQPQGKEEIKKILDKSIVGAVLAVDGYGTAHKVIKLQKFPGRHLEYRTERAGKEILGASRIFLRDGRMYFVVYSGTKESFKEEQSNQFLNSFKFIKIEKSSASDKGSKSGKNSKASSSDKTKKSEKKNKK